MTPTPLAPTSPTPSASLNAKAAQRAAPDALKHPFSLALDDARESSTKAWDDRKKANDPSDPLRAANATPQADPPAEAPPPPATQWPVHPTDLLAVPIGAHASTPTDADATDQDNAIEAPGSNVATDTRPAGKQPVTGPHSALLCAAQDTKLTPGTGSPPTLTAMDARRPLWAGPSSAPGASSTGPSPRAPDEADALIGQVAGNATPISPHPDATTPALALAPLTPAREGTAPSVAFGTELQLSGDLGIHLVQAQTRDDNAAPTVYRATLASHPQHSTFPGELNTQVRFLLATGLQQAELHLNPAELGPIHIQVHMTAQTADISFVATHSATREGILQALPALRELLSSQGLHLGQAGLGAGPGGQGFSPSGHSSHSGTPRRGTRGEAGGVAAGAVELSLQRPSPERMLDAYA